jgi:hypothetical protein
VTVPVGTGLAAWLGVTFAVNVTLDPWAIVVFEELMERVVAIPAVTVMGGEVDAA